MTERVAKLMAQVTAGTPNIDIWAGGVGGTIETVNLVMGAIGMGKAGRIGTLLLVANYCEDDNARRVAETYLTRWAWLTWLVMEPAGDTVTSGQMARLVSVALGQHIDPEAGRRTSLKAVAELVGVNHQTYAKKYRRHFQRIQAEIAYHESEAILALERHLG